MLKRSDGRWQEKITLPGMKKPKYFYGKTQKEVKQKMVAWTEEKEKGKLFSSCLDAWMEDHEKMCAYNTMKAYHAPLNRLREQFGDREVNDITADEVNAYVRKLANRGYAQRTVVIEFACLNMIFDNAIVNGYASVNPCGPVKLPSGMPKAKREMPTEEQIEAVKNGVHAPFGLFPYMLLYTGMRKGELLALRWEDIDFEAGLIEVSKSVYHVGNNPQIKAPKTEAGKRSVILLDALREVLTEPGTGYIFGGERPLKDYEFRVKWAEWSKAVGLHKGGLNAEITPHQLRHAYATILYDAGVGDADAMHLMGHSSIKVTREVYTHIRKERMEQTAARINKYLQGETDR